MTKKANAAEQLSANAERILTYSRKVLTAEIPELMPAFFLLRCDRTDVPGGLYTDGSTLYYHPETVVQNYLQDKRSICRQLLHIVLHGLQGHFFKRQGQHEEIFDAVADAKTAYLMERFGYGSKKLPAGAQKLIWRTSKLSMETACFAVTKEEAKKLSAFAAALYSDDHSRWMPPARAGGNAGGSAGDGGWDQWSDVTVQCARQFARSPPGGDLAGALAAVYREVEPSGVSYGEFLRRFLSVEEITAVDPDSIDRIWYHIGLDYLGDIPFIEPDELCEEGERISLAVALDTSGSCCGDTMRDFLRELMGILRVSPRLSVTLIQCDAEVQKVHPLTNEDDVEQLFHSFEMYGGGGTDFRPVFRYLKEQRESGEGLPFQGLLYLSDGFGSFPETAPDYPVAFLFPREEDCFWSAPEVPEWVTKVSILEDNTLQIA